MVDRKSLTEDVFYVGVASSLTSIGTFFFYLFETETGGQLLPNVSIDGSIPSIVETYVLVGALVGATVLGYKALKYGIKKLGHYVSQKHTKQNSWLDGHTSWLDGYVMPLDPYLEPDPRIAEQFYRKH